MVEVVSVQGQRNQKVRAVIAEQLDTMIDTYFRDEIDSRTKLLLIDRMTDKVVEVL